MIGNHIAHHDIFFGLSGAYHWNIKMEGVNDHLSKVEQVKRLMYFPLSWFYFYSPILAAFLFWKLFSKITLKNHIWFEKKLYLYFINTINILPYLDFLLTHNVIWNHNEPGC